MYVRHPISACSSVIEAALRQAIQCPRGALLIFYSREIVFDLATATTEAKVGDGTLCVSIVH